MHYVKKLHWASKILDILMQCVFTTIWSLLADSLGKIWKVNNIFTFVEIYLWFLTLEVSKNVCQNSVILTSNRFSQIAIYSLAWSDQYTPRPLLGYLIVPVGKPSKFLCNTTPALPEMGTCTFHPWGPAYYSVIHPKACHVLTTLNYSNYLILLY